MHTGVYECLFGPRIKLVNSGEEVPALTPQGGQQGIAHLQIEFLTLAREFPSGLLFPIHDLGPVCGTGIEQEQVDLTPLGQPPNDLQITW